MESKLLKRKARHARIKQAMDKTKPRLVVYRSLKHIYAQLVDDLAGKTLVSASDMQAAAKKGKAKKERARDVGKSIAKLAVEKGITTCVFDRAGYKYHGRVKEVAEGAREGGLQF